MPFTFILGILDVHFCKRADDILSHFFSKALWLRLLADASDSNFSKGVFANRCVQPFGRIPAATRIAEWPVKLFLSVHLFVPRLPLMLQTAHSSHAALDALLRPRSIVVIGASSMPASRGYHVWRSVALSTGLNALWPVNPKYRFVGEHRCYPNAYAIPDSEIDLAILCVKSKHLPNALKSL